MPVLFTLGGAALLLIPAILNGYPLVNSDDGTYLHSGFMPEMPGDRPIAYGLLLRLFSLNGLSLWIAAAVQAMVMAWLILRTAQHTLGGRYTHIAGFSILAILSLTTSLSWITSEIIPDVCTPMALLAAWLLLNAQEPRRHRVLLYIIYTLAVATHISHVMIFGLLVGGFFLFRKWWMPPTTRAAAKRTVLTLGILTTAMLLTMLKPLGHSKHIFTMAALLDQGILKPYLDETCPTHDYRLCRYKDSLNPDPNHFLWESGSPVNQEGGWTAVRDEYNRIISDVHSRPKYLRMRLQASGRATVRQTTVFGIGDGNFPFGEESHVHKAVQEYAPRDERAYLAAWQHIQTESVEDALLPANRIIYAVVIVSAIALLIMLVGARKRLSPTLRFFILFSLAGIVLNLWNCATFAQVNGRYGCRVMWLIPFCAALCGLAIFQKAHKAAPVES